MVEFLESKYFKWVKKSILDTSKGDNDKIEWKEGLVEFINDECDREGMEFFFYALPYMRFVIDPGHIAYTTPDKIMCFYAPNNEVEDLYGKWMFIYFHECLHQLWDTWGAEKEIEEATGKECDSYIMNIASDCVINEFLMRNLKLEPATDGLVTAKYLSEKYGVSYNHRKDTQTSMYLKLLEVADKIKKNPPQDGNPDNERRQPPQNGGGSSGAGQSGGGGQQQQPNKQSDDYVAGWNQAMADFAAGKIKL